MNNSDLTFITNEGDKSLLERFRVLIKDTEFFDVLVGYFFSSGFYALYKSLENTKKIRILIGINTNKNTAELIEKARNEQLELQYSHAEVKQELEKTISSEMEQSEDNATVEQGIIKFLEWLKNGKLEIRAYPTENIHAKLYIMTFAQGDRDAGRVITGSSNFSQAGLRDNLEFNVELKNRADYDYALSKFNELWKDSVDVKDKYIETIETKSWINNNITPYELYLKFLYEYFKDDLSRPEDIFYKYLPPEFKKLEYQEQAVLNANKILDEYGGVFISDVVGLGKTYISAMLAQQLDGRNLVIAPPMLLAEDNPGSWTNVFRDFNVPATFESLGKLDHLIQNGTEGYKNVFIDEAHRFRTETTSTYEKLAQICRGKRVILVTATPYNNSPKDILSQIKLFQKGHKSTIPNLPDIERFFNSLNERLKGLDRKQDYTEYINVVRDNAHEIREKVLKYLMVRRTRAEIQKWYGKDLEAQKLRFPDVSDPEAIFYKFDDEEDAVFSKTIDLLANSFKYSRYTPLLHYKGEVTQPEKISQENMGKFMKILTIKRLESSFFAFRNTLDRFIHSYESFLKEYKNGNIYVSKKYSSKIFEYLDLEDEEAIQRLIDEDKAVKYKAEDFEPEYKFLLESDLAILREIYNLWKTINRDPKFLSFKEKLHDTTLLTENKLIIFTESKETATYLSKQLNDIYPDKVLTYTGGSSSIVREKVIENFDAKSRFPKDDYRILVATEVLSEGVNLHRSNVVINYDIPWNPTRLMQRVGRVNRVDTKFDRIFSYNFFPTKQSNDQIKLKEAAEAKIHAFISMLGADARLLTEGEPIESHELFNRLMSKVTITGEDESEESELKYLHAIKTIRDKNPDLFEKIKRLPKKSRTARSYKSKEDCLLTYFRKGKLQKFYKANKSVDPEELDFLTAAKTLEVDTNERKESIKDELYELLEKNKKAFGFSTIEDLPDTKGRRGRDSATQVLRILKSNEIKLYKGFTDEDEIYLKQVTQEIEEGGLPKQTTKTLIKLLNDELKNSVNPLKILALLKMNIANEFFVESQVQNAAKTSGPREVILSEYLVSK